MRRIFILNDLFVLPGVRRLGAASALIQTAEDYGRRAGAVGLVLSTELTNTTAQAVYEKLGWKRDTVFCTYERTL
jgi:GNAT superfamily N-acetyltransferase